MDLHQEKTELQHQVRAAKMQRDPHAVPRADDALRVARNARRARFWERLDRLFSRRRPN